MNHHNQHRYEMEQARLDQATEQFNESEKVLNLLRTLTATPIKPATEEEILLWNKQRHHPSPF
jgi:hypothetical protein